MLLDFDVIEGKNVPEPERENCEASKANSSSASSYLRRRQSAIFPVLLRWLELGEGRESHWARESATQREEQRRDLRGPVSVVATARLC
ncbi:Hypothetical predicted protein [Podarcis lilfordi]|uniref:Uncharacterized protein n=1 Tax=Podarcis lilfordi TaxID=74358 RepID=A0AA35NW32_9SAUR|nr:Hypothetical predicted protein [Podarcis lilfordi]